MSEYVLTSNGELYHFGIKGMKWGVRRYQNKNGSLTPAGKKRYSDDPKIKALKSDMETSKVAMKEAEKAYTKASNKVSYIPTKANRKEADKAFNNYREAERNYQKSKLSYTTNKEAARIKDKGIEIENKSKHRLKLEEQYKKLGMTDEQAQAAANKRIRTEKILAASAAVTVVACATYVVNKNRKARIDGIIKAGENLQRIEMRDTKGKLNDVFYASKGERDSKRYEKMLGFARKQATGEAYLMKLQATNDVKVASQHNARKAFVDLYNNDKNFRVALKSELGDSYQGKISGPRAKKAYEKFNRALVDTSRRSDGSASMFYSKLKSAGYGAVQDINDMKYSGYAAKNPLIIFDNSKGSIMVKSVKELTNPSAKDATLEMAKAAGETLVDNYMTAYGPIAAAGITAKAATTYASDPSKNYVNNN